jgi:nucleotide-binding universal stress UspA family protein
MTSADQQPIVVGIDGSENSLAALRWALREGVATGAQVEVVHCWTAQTLTDVVFVPDRELQTASICMLTNEVQAALSKCPNPPVTTQISLPGNPATALIRHAANARMLVLGVRQTTAMRDLAYGSVASSCRKHASCPVVTVDQLHVATWHQSAHRHATVG